MIKSNVYDHEETPEHIHRQEYNNINNIDIDMGDSKQYEEERRHYTEEIDIDHEEAE